MCGFWGTFRVPTSVLTALHSMSSLVPPFLNHFSRVYFYYLQNIFIMSGKMEYDPLHVPVMSSNDALKFSPTSFA